MAPAAVKITIAAVAGIIASIIIGIIIGSFSYLHYYEIGLKRQSSTGYIYTDEVYQQGRHFTGPLKNFKIYPSTAQFVSLLGINIFTKNKLTMAINIYFQYFIRPSQLPWLHQNHELDYNAVIKKKAISAIKDATVEFNTTEFIKNRTEIESRLFKAVRERLGGRCCQLDCQKYFSDNCDKGCVPYNQCTKDDSGTFVDVRYFHLGGVRMPSSVYERYLDALKANEVRLTENYKQQRELEEKHTKLKVEQIRNRVNEVTKNATAQAKLTRERSEAAAKRIVEQAHSDGLKSLMSRVGLTSPDQKLSYHYLSTLRATDKAYYTVDFNSIMLAAKP